MCLRFMKSNRDEFFGEKPVEYSFSDTLIAGGFDVTYKPREVFFKKLLDSLHITSSDRVLDVGSGDGILLERIIKQYGCQGVGVDVSRESIDRSKKRFSKNKKSTYRVSRAESLPFKNNSFNVVVSFDTLEHVGDEHSSDKTRKYQENAIKEIYRVLKPNGRFLVYTINKNQEYTWNQLMNKIGFDIYGPFDHYHQLFLDPQTVKSTFEDLGAKNVSLKLFNSFFTLMVDEVIMIVSRVVAKSKSRLLEKIAVKVFHYISVSLYGILFFMELPWRFFGRSNSFSAIGEKS